MGNISPLADGVDRPEAFHLRESLHGVLVVVDTGGAGEGGGQEPLTVLIAQDNGRRAGILFVEVPFGLSSEELELSVVLVDLEMSKSIVVSGDNEPSDWFAAFPGLDPRALEWLVGIGPLETHRDEPGLIIRLLGGKNDGLWAAELVAAGREEVRLPVRMVVFVMILEGIVTGVGGGSRSHFDGEGAFDRVGERIFHV